MTACTGRLSARAVAATAVRSVAGIVVRMIAGLAVRATAGFAVAACAGLAACGAGEPPHEEYALSGATMGTAYSVKLVAPPADLDRGRLHDDVDAALAAVERSMSTYLPDSELSRFNATRDTGWFEVSAALCEAVAGALSISMQTGGAFDVTAGPLVNLWGFGPESVRSEPPGAAEVAAALQTVGHAKLHTDCTIPALRKDVAELYVDLSAFAKGHAVDEIAALLDARSVVNYLVEIGGELRVSGRNARGEPWAVAIETPARAARSVQKIANLTDTAIATSGDYRNFFEHEGRYYSHTIDPTSGRPIAHDGASVTVVATPAAYADAMATALLVMGPEKGVAFAERADIAAYFLSRSADGIEERMSRRFAEEVEGR